MSEVSEQTAPSPDHGAGTDTMSRREFGGFFSGALTAISATYLADRLGVINIAWTPGTRSWLENRLHPERKAISLEVPPLAEEVQLQYVASTVQVNAEPKSIYSQLNGARCAGTAIGGGKVITAAHCTRLIEDKEGHSFTRIGDDGQDILNRVYVTVGDQEFHVAKEMFFTGFEDGSNDADVVILDSPELRGSEQATLALGNHETLARGTPVYLFSRFGDADARVRGGVITEVPEPGSADFLQVAFRVDGSVNDVVLPGVSGTGLIDGQGKFVGSTVGHSISTTQEFFTVTEEAATTHGFADSEIGRNVIIAHFAPVSLAQELLN